MLNRSSHFLISGTTAASTSNALPVGGMTDFTVTSYATGFGNNVPTGTITLQGQGDGSSNWGNILSNSFTNTGTILNQFRGPYTNLRGVLSLTTGTFFLSVLYSKDTKYTNVDGGII